MFSLPINLLLFRLFILNLTRISIFDIISFNFQIAFIESQQKQQKNNFNLQRQQTLNKMNLLTQVIGTIEQKQTSVMHALESNGLQAFYPTYYADYFRDLPNRFFQRLQARVEGHGKVINKYLFQGSIKDFNLQKVTTIIETKQEKSKEKFTQSFENMFKADINVEVSDLKEGPMRREREQSPIANIQVKMAKNDQTQDLNHQNTIPIQQRDPNEKSTSKKIEFLVQKEKIQSNRGFQQKQRPNQHQKETLLNIRAFDKQIQHDRSLSHYQKKATPVSQHLAASQIIIKRDILKDLQEKRKQLQQKEPKSKKMKNKVIRLEPIARRQEMQQKQKEAKQKLFAGIEFLQSIAKRKNNSFKIKITEWRQDRLNAGNSNQGNTNKYTFKKIDTLRRDEFRNNFQGGLGSKIFSASGVQKYEKIGSRVEKIQKNFVLVKPIPYNIYSIHFSKDEQFKLPDK